MCLKVLSKVFTISIMLVNTYYYNLHDTTQLDEYNFTSYAV